MPLLGSYGGSSEYAYRGTIDDFPDDFSFTNQTNATPGDLFTSNQVTITGINNRALVRVSAGASVSVNGGSYVIPTEASPVFIRNNETLTVRIQSTVGQLTDFNKLYSANVSVGKKTALWQVRTKIVDIQPTAFSFTNQTNREIGVAYTSNEITISGLEPGFSFPALITSGSGQIVRNGGVGIAATDVVNGDRIFLRLISPFEYSEFPTGSGRKTNTTTVQVGSYSTSWSVSSRDVDIFILPFDFEDVDNAPVPSFYEATAITNTGIATTTTATLTLTSTTVSSGSSAPNSIYRAAQPGALNRTPQLSWGVSGLPPGVSVQSYAIQLEDLSTVPTRFVHWNLTGIASTITKIDFASDTLPAVGVQGPTSWPNTSFLNGAGYGGPQPPSGERHTYRITVRANLTGAGSSSVLVSGINFLAGAGVSSPVLSATYPDQSNVISGILTNVITGADQGIPLVTAVSGCELRVEQPAVSGGFSIRRPYSTENAIVFNGDRITARIIVPEGNNFSEAKIGIVTVSNAIGEFRVTTRPRPIDTIPDKFVFPGITTDRGSTVESNEITLAGMTTATTDEGLAGITTGVTGGNARFQVTRGTQIVKSYDTLTSPFRVRNGDKIKLRITADAEPERVRSVTLRIDGRDTRVIVSGTDAFEEAKWDVTSAIRLCGITTFTLQPLNNADPNTNQSINFTVGGFQSDCGMRVSTSGGGSSLSVSGSSLTNNIPVSPGTQVTLRMASGDFGEKRTATVTVSNAASGILPSQSYSTTWEINTVPDTRATELTLSADKSTVSSGSTFALTWTSINAAQVNSSIGFPQTPTTVKGNVVITPTTLGQQTYSLTVQGPPTSTNPGPVTRSVTITVSNDTTADDFTLSPSNYADQSLSSEVSATTTVSGLTDGVTVPASISGNASRFTVTRGGTLVNTTDVRNGDVIRVFMTNSSSPSTTVTGTLSFGGRSASFTSKTIACSSPTKKVNLATGVDLDFVSGIYTDSNGSETTSDLYVSRSGSGLNSNAREVTSGASVFQRSIGAPRASQQFNTISVTIPAEATDIDLAAVGGGGGGSASSKGGGGGGYGRYRNYPLPGGGTIIIEGGAEGTSTGSGVPSKCTINGVNVVEGFGGRGGGFTPNGGAGGGSVGLEGAGGGGEIGAFGGSGGGDNRVGGFGGEPGSGITGGGTQAGFIFGGSGGGVAFSKGTNGIIVQAIPGQNAQQIGGIAAARGGRADGSGGGGGGGSNSTFGCTGSAAVFYKLPGLPATTWDALISAIVEQFRTSANRPPTETELKARVSEFRNSSTLSLDSLKTNISNQVARASGYTNSCRGSFTYT